MSWFHGLRRSMPQVSRHAAPPWSSRVLSVALGIAAVLTLSVCSDSSPWDDDEWSDDPCSPNYVEGPDVDGFGVIGPEGGTVRVTDPEDPSVGMEVSVPAGVWTACWEVGILYRSIFSTEDYPDGYVPFERPMPTGSVDIVIFRWTPDTSYDAPDSMYVEVSFPVHQLQRSEIELFSAFYYDSTNTTWRVRLPDGLTDSALTVQTKAWRRRWSWGRIDLAEIDFERHIEPALEERVGTETWNEIKATVDSVYDAAMRSRWEPITCFALNFAEGTFASFRDYSATMVRAIQAGFNCGTCDATTRQFYDELVEYIKLNLQYMLVEMFTDMIPGRLWPLKIAGFAMMGSLLAAMENLNCDYECLVKRAPPPFYLYTASYWVSYLVVEGIQWFKSSGYIHCGPEAWAAPPPQVPLGGTPAGMCIG